MSFHRKTTLAKSKQCNNISKDESACFLDRRLRTKRVAFDLSLRRPDAVKEVTLLAIGGKLRCTVVNFVLIVEGAEGRTVHLAGEEARPGL